ncbi:hypothetical protein OCJ37_00065 [Xanthomonas sp. AM6]|uniref:hypothetical protein n=1 Tax=Xanthomonas sp. AM6 TaxID=2982531 RepID=UPI0021D9B05C|nr:hypothetical protein [Xanthomonas sp. AM6]UYB52404.1 hypothetical protein OCJ37_00065 [Xanthomonas sp. AM6]
MPPLDQRHFKDLALSQRLRLVLLGVGVLFPMFFVATVKPVFLPVAVQLGCLTALLLLRRRWLGGSYVPAMVSAAAFLAASAVAWASLA